MTPKFWLSLEFCALARPGPSRMNSESVDRPGASMMDSESVDRQGSSLATMQKMKSLQEKNTTESLLRLKSSMGAGTIWFFMLQEYFVRPTTLSTKISPTLCSFAMSVCPHQPEAKRKKKCIRISQSIPLGWAFGGGQFFYDTEILTPARVLCSRSARAA